MTRRRKPLIVMGIDPGTAYTGVAICSVDSENIAILRLEVIRTSPELTTRERFDKINNRILHLIQEYKVERVINEAFEVRGWQKGRSKATTMSKLINAISQAVFTKKIPFMLSSPDIKKDKKLKLREKELSEEIQRNRCSYMEHAEDAIRHVIYWSDKGLK